MANEYAVNSQDLKAVADAIRTKGGTSESLVFPGGFATAIENIKAGENVEQATPTINVSSGGLITASATQEAGLVAAGTKSATKQMTVQAAQTITPGTSNKTIASGRYLTGTQTIKGDSNLVAANIKKGVSIFGVAGGYAGVELDFTVVGGTSQPSSPIKNTIWVNTNTTISSYIFSASQPSSPSSGMVWIKVSGVSNAAFNALKTNGIYVYPNSAKQFVGGVWVDKTVKIYQNGTWVDLLLYFYNYGNEFTDLTGGWKCVYESGYASNASNTANGLYAKSTSQSGAYVHNWYTKKAVDITKLTTLYAKVKTTKKPEMVRFMIHTDNTNTGNNNAGAYTTAIPEANVETLLSFDVSGFSGSYYIKLNYQGGDSAEVRWTEVWGE